MREGTHEDTIDALERLQEENSELVEQLNNVKDLLARRVQGELDALNKHGDCWNCGHDMMEDIDWCHAHVSRYPGDEECGPFEGHGKPNPSWVDVLRYYTRNMPELFPNIHERK